MGPVDADSTVSSECLFKVVGGSSKGGIIVREGKGICSVEASERLATGSLVKALEHEAGRIHYELVSGSGPASGWVSSHAQDKALLERQGEHLESLALQWYGELFAAAEEEEEEVQPGGWHGRQSFGWCPTVKAEISSKAELEAELCLGGTKEQPREEKQESVDEQLCLTFGYPAGTGHDAAYAKFDIRDDVCRRVGGFRHGQVVKDTGNKDREFVVVGVKFHVQAAEVRLWLQPQDLGRRGSVPFKREDLNQLVPVYKGLTKTIRKRVDLCEASFDDFEAVEDSDGEAILLCKACRLPVGRSLYADEAGNALHAECMAQHVQCQMREKEEALQQKEAQQKDDSRSKFSIGWKKEHIPLNTAPAVKLGLENVPRGMCGLMVQEVDERTTVAIVPTVDPAAAVNLEYLSLALKVRHLEGREPTFSLDPVAASDAACKMQAKCFEPRWLKGTSAGEVLFQSDYHLKELSMGECAQPVVGMKSCFDYATSEAGKEWHAREWYVVNKAEMHLSEDNVLIPHLNMGVEAREQLLGSDGLEDKPITRADHPLVLYAQDFTENFDLIAERKSVVFYLRELAKASLMAKFLLESEVALDESWLSLANEASSDCCMEIPQLWNERSLAQIRVCEGKIMDALKLHSPEHHGVYGGVKFGLDRFRLGGAVTTRPGLRAAPSVAVRAAMPTLSMSDVRSMGMLVASMQGKGAAPPPAAAEVAAVPGAAPAVSRAMVPGMPMRGAAPMGPAPTRPSASAGQLARQMQGMLVSKPGLDGRRARLDVPSLHGVDLNLDKFDLDDTVRVPTQACGHGAHECDGGALAKGFWANLGNHKSIFNAEDKALLQQVFNPKLSDRRDEGDNFMPPNPSAPYVEKLRQLVKREDKVRRLRKEHFFSSAFVANSPGPLFPSSWNASFEISHESNAGAKVQGNHLKARPDYLAQASMFDHALQSAKPVFDRTTEEGLRFRLYKFGTLDVRTTQELDGEEVIGAVFSCASAGNPANSRHVGVHEKIVKVSEYVKVAHKDDALCRRSYIVLETAEGSVIVTAKQRNGTVSWEVNPEDLEDRNSIAKFVRSCACSLSKKTTVTVGDMEIYKNDKGKAHGATHSGCKRYAQGAFCYARGTGDRCDSGFGSKNAWHKQSVAKSTQKEARRQNRKAQVTASRAAAQGPADTARPGGFSTGRKVIDPIIIGTWDDWTCGELMAFDEQSMCYVIELQVGSTGRESFQILCDGDWDLCLHPDKHNACSSGEFKLCGPDANGHGKNWTVGAHEDDQAVPGMVYQILLNVDEHGVAQKVEWERLGLPAECNR